MTCPICDEELEQVYHVMDFDNEEGVRGSICLSKELFDEDDHQEVSFMILRVIDAWLKRRLFEHTNAELYHTIS